MDLPHAHVHVLQPVSVLNGLSEQIALRDHPVVEILHPPNIFRELRRLHQLLARHACKIPQAGHLSLAVLELPSCSVTLNLPWCGAVWQSLTDCTSAPCLTGCNHSERDPAPLAQFELGVDTVVPEPCVICLPPEQDFLLSEPDDVKQEAIAQSLCLCGSCLLNRGYRCPIEQLLVLGTRSLFSC
jgi:hypothetical protein